MSIDRAFIRELYNNFNNRNIDAVIENMTQNVQWENGREGGFCIGQEEVRQYWLRQFDQVNSKVYPINIKTEGEHAIVYVHQVVHDLNNHLLSDNHVEHHFETENGKITRFTITKPS